MVAIAPKSKFGISPPSNLGSASKFGLVLILIYGNLWIDCFLWKFVVIARRVAAIYRDMILYLAK